MDVSSVTAAPAVAPIDSGNSQPPAQSTNTDNNSAYQPPPKPPLPPGQGTRVDQLA